ncbi:hypothetical protein C7212DRAFT_362779 [Tuber magnatum]|uniref:Uncharacterized protein n=1 Tax=Tuber magnatum TaxID=42249 RepID=A0A317SVN6_9PEZI|nr:hypothetical protein C7212DRAFT_362779 [Tuber magnatum]
MDSGTGFWEFIFSESPKDFSKSPKDFKAAYESLDSAPCQIFDLLLREEYFTNFFSRMEVYGNNLASLFSQFPTFQKDDDGALLLQESIRAFTLSLLAERIDDIKSENVVAGVVVSCFEGLISEPQAKEKWVGFIMDICKGCGVHRSGPKRTSGVELAKFIRTVPCEFCTANISFDYRLSQGEPTRSRDDHFGSSMGSKVFQSLLGEPLGPWKIIISQQAMENLGAENAQGNFEYLRRKFTELASGDWGGKKILHRARWDNSLSYRMPLFQAFYKTGHFILWQIDAAFDERIGENYQYGLLENTKVDIKIKQFDKLGVQIHRAQQVYPKALVDACNRDSLDGSWQLRYPVGVSLEGEEAGKVAYPVTISAEEANVVDHILPPAFILGRSGTGKTTCLVYKLVGRYLLYSTERDEPLRQFSSLTDADFPLVCTFDYLLRLIENSIREQEKRRRYMKINNSKRGRLIDFNKFNILYWKQLSSRLKRGVRVDLAFLEIMGVIKGSVSPATNFNPLSRGEYVGRSWRVSPNLASERERDAVYDLYEWYERVKKKRGDIDQVDRIVKVMKALEAFKASEISEDILFERRIRSMLDEIYVDG